MKSPAIKNRVNWTLIIHAFFVVLLIQAFAFPEIDIKKDDLLYKSRQENKQEEWLKKWTSENIGKGFFLPEMESQDGSLKSNNVLEILMNQNDEFLIENHFVEKENVKLTVKNFLNGTNPDRSKRQDFSRKDIPFLGKVKVSKGIISYKHDLASSNEMVNNTLRSIGEAYLEVKNETTQLLFESDYFELDIEKQKAIDEALPIRFFYELPKSPTPSVWLPYDRKPSKPDPINITFKGNGLVFVENYKFNTLDEFEENLKYWKEQLDEFNKKQKIKGYYRANVVFEDIPRSDQQNIDYLLEKSDVHVERSFSNIRSKSMTVDILPDSDGSNLENTLGIAKRDFPIYNDDLKILIQYHEGVTFEQVKSARDSFLALGIKNIEVKEYKYVKPSAPLFLLALHANEIQNVFSEVVPLDSIPNYAEGWLKNVEAKYSARIDVYQNVSKEQIQELKQAMQKGGITEDIIVNNISQ